MIKKLIFGLLLIIMIQNVFAIGITPGRTTINFEPNLQKQGYFSIINSENKEMSVVFMVRGNFSEYLVLNEVYSEFLSSDKTKSFTYTVNLPNEISSPGRHEIEIVALETPKDIKEKGSFVGATVAVITKVDIYVPYPEKYVEAEINIIESEGKEIFLIPVTNRGELDIGNLRAIVDVYDGLGNKLASLESNTETLKSLERKELVLEFNTQVQPGIYNAKVSVFYDNEIARIEKNFEVGEKLLEILEINVNDFELGSIAQFNTLVENKWSQPLKEVYLNIIIFNENGKVMADFKSPTYDIDALSKIEMVAFWNTVGVKEGQYDGKISLIYGEKETDKEVEVKITENSIEVIGLTGQVIIKKGGTFNLNNILLILVVFLVIVNIVWLIIFMKRKKSKSWLFLNINFQKEN